MGEKKYKKPIIISEIINLESDIVIGSIDLTIGGANNSIPEITDFEAQSEISENYDFNL